MTAPTFLTMSRRIASAVEDGRGVGRPILCLGESSFGTTPRRSFKPSEDKELFEIILYNTSCYRNCWLLLSPIMLQPSTTETTILYNDKDLAVKYPNAITITGTITTGPGVIIGTQIRNQCKSTRKSSIDTCDAPIKSSLSLLVHTVLLFLIFSFKKKL